MSSSALRKFCPKAAEREAWDFTPRLAPEPHEPESAVAHEQRRNLRSRRAVPLPVGKPQRQRSEAAAFLQHPTLLLFLFSCFAILHRVVMPISWAVINGLTLSEEHAGPESRTALKKKDSRRGARRWESGEQHKERGRLSRHGAFGFNSGVFQQRGPQVKPAGDWRRSEPSPTQIPPKSTLRQRVREPRRRRTHPLHQHLGGCCQARASGAQVARALPHLAQEKSRRRGLLSIAGGRFGLRSGRIRRTESPSRASDTGRRHR